MPTYVYTSYTAIIKSRDHYSTLCLEYSSSGTLQRTQPLSSVIRVCTIHYTVIIFSLLARINDSRIELGSLAYSEVSISALHRLALNQLFSDTVYSLLVIPYHSVRSQCSKGQFRHTNASGDAVVAHMRRVDSGNRSAESSVAW
jgi:hypothetical protein